MIVLFVILQTNLVKVLRKARKQRDVCKTEIFLRLLGEESEGIRVWGYGKMAYEVINNCTRSGLYITTLKMAMT